MNNIVGVDFTIHCKYSLIPDQNVAKKSGISLTPLKEPLTKSLSPCKINRLKFMRDVNVEKMEMKIQTRDLIESGLAQSNTTPSVAVLRQRCFPEILLCLAFPNILSCG